METMTKQLKVPPKEGPLESQTIPQALCAWACVSVCARRLCAFPKVWQYTRSSGGQVRRVKFLSPHHPPSAHEYETESTTRRQTNTSLVLKLSGEPTRSRGSYDFMALLLANNCNSTLNSLKQPFHPSSDYFPTHPIARLSLHKLGYHGNQAR